MNSFFEGLTTSVGARTGPESSEKLLNSEMDDLVLDEGMAAVSISEMKETAAKAEQFLQSPTTPRPAVQSFGSDTLLMSGGLGDVTDDQDIDEDEALSVNTDINRHQREIESIGSALSAINRKIDVLPDLDARMRKMALEFDEIQGKIAALQGDLTNTKRSFNLYQSNTANKIVDVERRALEKQLRADAKADTSLVPPDVVTAAGSDTGMNRQVDTAAQSALAPQVKPKSADMSDW